MMEDDVAVTPDFLYSLDQIRDIRDQKYPNSLFINVAGSTIFKPEPVFKTTSF